MEKFFLLFAVFENKLPAKVSGLAPLGGVNGTKTEPAMKRE